MARFKLVDGLRVPMSSQEEAALVAEEAAAAGRYNQKAQAARLAIGADINSLTYETKVLLYYRWLDQKAQNPSLTVQQFITGLRQDAADADSIFGHPFTDPPN